VIAGELNWAKENPRSYNTDLSPLWPGSFTSSYLQCL